MTRRIFLILLAILAIGSLGRGSVWGLPPYDYNVTHIRQSPKYFTAHAVNKGAGGCPSFQYRWSINSSLIYGGGI